MVYLALFIPLVSFIILMASADWIGRRTAGWLGCGSVFLSFLIFVALLIQYNVEGLTAQQVTLFKWIPVEGIGADFSLLVDPLSLVMTLIVTGVGFLIHLYSNGYMEHDEDFARYFACMNFFVFSMLLLVLAANLLLLFVGWEGVGLASYLLIGFEYQRPAAALAATKAFVVNRIGDCGFLIGLLLIFTLFGTSDIQTMIAKAGGVGGSLMIVLTLLLFFGATGKSAQIPLHTWLPDAMEGPTPVSALIHAATMVTAGVYLVVRLHPIFELAPLTLQVVGVIGGVTSLFAALCAIGQTDLKKVLAYSTISQLGYMFLACGAGAYYAAMFHLTTHAFIKSLLFLSAGIVVHMMHGITDMDKMGGLRKIFTKTHWLFLIGALALSGIPPLAAFFSKDLILEEEYLVGDKVLFYVGLVTSILTGFYLMRAYFLTFGGAPRLEDKVLKAVKEGPAIMLVPVSILALLSIFGGLLGFGITSPLESFLLKAGVTLPFEEVLSGFLLTLAIGGAIIGVGSAIVLFYTSAENLRRPIRLFQKSFYIDNLYWGVFAVPLRGVARAIATVLEPKIFDRSITATARATQGIASWLQRVQSGQIRSYVAWMVLGSVLLVAYLAIR